jgi:hypothetical protein
MRRLRTLAVLLGLAGALAGCYVVSPTAYPGSVPPPPYTPPPVTGRPVPPAYGPTSTGPSTGRNCETVTVEGHWETVVRSSGQTERLWAPPHTMQVCR